MTVFEIVSVGPDRAANYGIRGHTHAHAGRVTFTQSLSLSSQWLWTKFFRGPIPMQSTQSKLHGQLLLPPPASPLQRSRCLMRQVTRIISPSRVSDEARAAAHLLQAWMESGGKMGMTMARPARSSRNGTSVAQHDDGTSILRCDLHYFWRLRTKITSANK